MPASKGGRQVASAKIKYPSRLNVAVIVLALAALACAVTAGTVDAKTPGTVHCYGGWCHRIHTVDETAAMVGRRGYVNASYYDDCKRDRFNPCGLTSSGAVFRSDRPDNAASPIFPDGTVLLTYNPDTRMAAVLRVTSAGPYRGDRTLDVSRATAEHLGFKKRGVAALEVAILKSPEDFEARYSRQRMYEPVPGFIGAFETFDAAHDAALSRMRLDAAGIAVATTDPQITLDRLSPPGLSINGSTALPSAAVAVSEFSFASAVELVAMQTLADSGPLQVLIAHQVSDGESLTHSAHITTNGDAQQGLIARLLSFVAVAQDKARLRRDADDTVQAAASDGDQRNFMDRAKTFIRAAQFRARLGARGTIAMPDAVASVKD
ncbi:MAG: septal ring lytic transglycosylase RlpA family protein [Hyphomicrobium sp.]